MSERTVTQRVRPVTSRYGPTERSEGVAASAVSERSEESGERVECAESELDALAERAAEKIYASTQPYRYARLLMARGQSDESAFR